jgi:CDP-6-deoxy-D-xylo-4-hexulose-3-dehydrase
MPGFVRTMQTVDIMDVVRFNYSDFGCGTEETVHGLVYDINDEEIHVLYMLPYDKTRDSRLVKIVGEDLIESKLSHDCFVVTHRPLGIKKESITQRVGRINVQKMDEILRHMIYNIVQKHYQVVHGTDKKFMPGETYIHYAGRVYDAKEITAVVDSALDFWLTAGRFAKQFEEEFAKFLGVKYCILTNSGSSANLLAISALTSPKLGERRLNPGDEVITTACAFPTTVNPIIQNNLIPVFLDVEVGTYNIDVNTIESAISDRTKAIFIAHTLGNPFDVEKIVHVCNDNNLWLIEDNCDALGSKYGGNYTGTFGDIATCSFYPAHHITMGEGGSLVTNDTALKRLIQSFRDWGRDCWCEPGYDNTCGKRFDKQLGNLPYGYDHKYTYSHVGYNLKVTDMQAAVGVEQLKKLPLFVHERKENWRRLYEGLEDYTDFFILPECTDKSEPCWFGFLLTVKEGVSFSRDDIVKHLEESKIATRMLFSGNITRHPSFENVEYRTYGDLRNTDFIMNNTFWVGVYPGLTDEMIDYTLMKICDFFG